MQKIFAYLRVSSEEQNTDRQLDAIKKYCKDNNLEIHERDIFIDKVSGKDFERPKYQALKQCLRAGDTLIIKELDRLGRNKEMIKQELDYFKQNKIRIKILNIPTTLIELPQESGWVMEMVNNILIEVMGAIAEEERNKIRARQAEGIASAKAQGKHLGRPRIEFPEEWEKHYREWKQGNITAVECFTRLELNKGTFYNLVKKYEGRK